MLCFPNSHKIKKYFNNYTYIITFKYISNLNFKQNLLKELNKASIEFIIDFIKNITKEKFNSKILNIFESSELKFLENIKSLSKETNFKNYIILSYNKENQNLYLKIDHLNKINDKEIFLYEPFIKFNTKIKEEEIQNYSSQIYNIIKQIKKENKIIYYNDKSKKLKNLESCIEVIKFYFRHKTYNELFCIDINRGDKTLLKSIIRKLNQFNYINIEKEKENEENIQRKNCFLLIYNCEWKDLLDVNIFSLLNNNSSFIIIYESNHYERTDNISQIVKYEGNELAEKSLNFSLNYPLIPYSNIVIQNNKLKEIGEYKIFQKLSNSSFSSIYAVMKKSDPNKKIYILKTLKKGLLMDNNIKIFQNEINILEELNKEPKCKYIPELYTVGKYKYPNEENNKENNNDSFSFDINKSGSIESIPYFVIDYYSKGNLYTYLEKLKLGEKSLIKEKHIKLLFKKIILAIQFCHRKNICHLNINPSNIVFDDEFQPKIIDYILSEKVDDSGVVEVPRGNIKYICPEMWEKNEFIGEKADIFSLGVLLINLVSGRHGFETSNENDLLYKCIIDNEIKEYWNSLKNLIGFDFSEDFKDLYIQMISFDPLNRPTIDQILKSKWMEELNNLNEKELDKELKDIMNSLYNEIKKEDEQILDINKIKFMENPVNIQNKSFTNIELKPTKIPNDMINLNKHIIIQGYLKPIDIMNSLIKGLETYYNKHISILTSNENLKFQIIFENDKDEEFEGEKKNIIDIELFEYEDGRYLLEFCRNNGEFSNFYQNFSKIRRSLMKIY